MEVVTADGQIRSVSADAPHDGLWYAMLHAGSSFAVATSLTLKSTGGM